MIVAKIRSAFVIPRGSLSQWTRIQPSSITRVMRSCVVLPPFQPNRLYSWTRPLLLQHTPTLTVDSDTPANDSADYIFNRTELIPPIIRRTWSAEETALLKQFMREGQSPKAVYKHFPQRNRFTVSKRMSVIRTTEKMEQKQVHRWSLEEDAILLKCIKERNTSKMATACLPDRTAWAVSSRTKVLSGISLKTKTKKRELAARWKPEEDKILYELFTQGIPPNEIYQHFPSRSMGAIDGRIRKVRQQIIQGLDSLPLQTTSRQTPKDQAPEQMANDANGKDQVGKVKLFWPRTVRRWTPAEDKLLEKLVKDFISQGKDMDEKDFWDNVANTALRFQRNGAPFTRDYLACQRRWKRLHATPSPNGLRMGQWDIEEDSRFRQSVQKLIGSDFQVRADILEVAIPFKRFLSNADEEDPRPGVRLRSPQMKKINWARVAADVGTRGKEQCRWHFYKSYHNGNRGAWSADEFKRFEDGVAKYGKDWSAVSQYMGTRTPGQLSTLPKKSDD